MNIIERIDDLANKCYDATPCQTVYGPAGEILSILKTVRALVGKDTALEKHAAAHCAASPYGETLELTCAQPLHGKEKFFAQLLPRDMLPCDGDENGYPMGHGNTMLAAILNLMRKL